MRAHPAARNPGAVNDVPRQPRYAIRVRGVLSERLLGAFPGLEARVEGGDTQLTGSLADQAALHGVLGRIEALGLDLIEVHLEDPATQQRGLGRRQREARS